METFSVGVSSLSQKIFLKILENFELNPEKKLCFEKSCRDSIKRSREIISSVNKNVIELPNNFLDIPGMFGWVKVINKQALIDSKINVLDGSLFGKDGYARLNLAFSEDVWFDFVERLKVF